MSRNVRERLQEELHRVDWKPLGPHAKRGGLFVVDGALDLVEVGVAVASDDSDSVRNWLEGKQLRRPTDDEISDWQGEGEERFTALIVQPYVLVQRDTDDA